ncbi:hypothetical protein BDD43_3780 [Mucilaginibacter gracilis]|uniref:Urease accessory protein UreH-like transmembrane domain-containing protein n=1 Tax=Mucilaginibacter gracilis TaxID=423350 RepID=A0A495J3M4_9SPHI|nr:sulfite exporter TauE/SafE family protein [Mucilaginibacter gracilis]RKR83570.1 hypothetical protein BDD43_3780 [Mucilaginibacter gracilis]
MNSNEIAFFIGLFGSIHCIGMCGPLAFAIPVSNNKWWLVVFDKVTYNIGRLLSYTFLGAIIGLLGRQLWLLGAQQGLSFISGLLIIMAGLSRLFKVGFANNSRLARLLSPINRLIVYALQHRAGHLIIGVLNGFLPCGFVYLALLGAVNTPSPASAAQYMFWFGLGTFPLMLLATLGSGFISAALRRQINRAIPYFMICLGFWFIIRGMELNIPYLSPAKGQVNVCH